MTLQYMIRDKDGMNRDFESLYEETFPEIFQYLMHCVGSVADAEDITAQVFLKAMKNLWRFRWSRGSFSSWLFRIAHNEMKSYYRRKGRAEKAWTDFKHVEAMSHCEDELEQAERERVKDQFYVSLQRSLAALSPDDCSLVVMKYFQGKSYQELGEIFGIRKGTLAMRIHRSLKKLKNNMDIEGLNHEEYRRCFESMSEA